MKTYSVHHCHWICPAEAWFFYDYAIFVVVAVVVFTMYVHFLLPETDESKVQIMMMTQRKAKNKNMFENKMNVHTLIYYSYQASAYTFTFPQIYFNVILPGEMKINSEKLCVFLLILQFK